MTNPTEDLSVVALVSDLSGVLGFPPAIALALLVTAFVVWACLRMRSTHFLLARAWRLIAGRSVDAPDFEAAVRDREQLLFFVHHTGIRSRTKARALAMQTWSKENDEELADIARCGHYMDLENVGLRKQEIPGSALRALMLFAGCGLALVLVMLTLGAATNKAILRTKATDILVLATVDKVTIWSTGHELSGASCARPGGTDEAKMQGLNQEEVDALCGHFQDPDGAKYIESTVQEQRIAFGSLAIGPLWFSLLLLFAYRRAVAADAMRQRLDHKAAVADANSASKVLAVPASIAERPLAATAAFDPARASGVSPLVSG